MHAAKVDSNTHALSGAQLATRFGLALALLLATTVTLSHVLRPQLEGLSHAFYDLFGIWGPAIGTWLAEGFNFPIPPQAYMLLAEARGATREVFPIIAAGSVAGGISGYLIAPMLTRFAWIRAIIERTQSKVSGICDRRWVLAGVILSVSPIPFSWLCYSAGLYRMPRRTLGLLCLLRVPKLAVYQLLISWGWS